jgi:hypothetical protein
MEIEMHTQIITPTHTVAGSDTGTVKIEIRSVYGKQAAYPVCSRAQLFAEMLGTRTLTHRALCQIERLGFEIVSIANADWSTVN